MVDKEIKKELARVRSEVRKVSEKLKTNKSANPFTGAIAQNYWSATGMPWVSTEGRKGVLTEWFWQPIRGQPRRVDTNELRQFSQTFWIHSCVATILDEITALDWDIVAKEDYPYESVQEKIKQVKTFLEYPNKNRESFYTMIRAVIKDLLEIDAGVIEKVFSLDSYEWDVLEPKSGAPLLKPIGQRMMTELYARDGASFLKEVDKFGFVRGYWQYSYQIPAHPTWFDKDNLCYISRMTRSQSCYGFSATQAILDIVKSLHYSTIYNKKFFEETSIPEGVLSILESGEPDVKAFTDQWVSEFKAQPHKFAVVNKPIDWKPLSPLQRELEFLETQSWYYKLVISAFGLTPSELGITEDLNRSTSATQSELSRRKGIRPLLKVIEAAMNESIISEFMFEGIEFQFIYDDPTEKAQRLANWKLEVDMGIKTPNEIREEMGLQPVSWGDEPRQQTAMNNFNNYGTENKKESGEKLSGEEERAGKESKRTYEQEEGKETKSEKSYKLRYHCTDCDFTTNSPNEAEQHENDTGHHVPILKEKSVDWEIKYKIEEYLDRGHNERDIIDGIVWKFDITRAEAKDAIDEIKRYRARQAKREEKGVKIPMDTDDLVSEHEHLVQVLERADPEELKAEADKQKKELADYKRQASKSVQVLTPDQAREQSQAQANSQMLNPNQTKPQAQVGPYYHETQESIQPSRGNIAQPQNKEEGEAKKKPLQHEKNQLKCPKCGKTTLTHITNDNLTEGDTYRCITCNGMFGASDLEDKANLNRMQETLMQTQSTSIVSIPKYRPKSFKKSVDSDMDVKEYVGFDYQKSISDTHAYINSKEYEKLLRKYFPELNALQRVKLKAIIAQGVNSRARVSDIAEKLNRIFKDKERSDNIAKTEIVRVTGQGNLMKIEEEGMTKKVKWKSAPEDGRRCEECAELNNKTFSLKQAKVYEKHPRCRCVWTEAI